MKKTYLVLAALVFLSKICPAQNTAYFSFDFNGYTIDKMIKTADNNYFGVLYFSQGKIFTKFDPTFHVIWAKNVSNKPNMDILDLAESNNGNFMALCGTADSSFLLKFSDAGALLSAKYFTSTTINNFTPTNITRSLTGDGVLVSGGYCNIPNYLIRLDDNFNILWQYQYKDGTGSCANTRSSDIITENNHYVYAFNPLNGGVNLVSVDDNGNPISANNYNLALQTTGFPIHLIKIQNGGYAATWESIVTANGTEYIYFDSATNYARCKKYNLNAWNYLYDLHEYTNNKIIIGGTTQIGTLQSNIYFGVNEKGEVLWSNTSEGVVNPNSAEVVKCFAQGLDNSVFAFGGGGLDGASGAKLDFNGNGFCNSANQIMSIASADSAAGVSRTITKNTLVNLVAGNLPIVLKDTTFTRTVRCGALDNTPLSISTLNVEDFKIYPNPSTNQLNIDFPFWGKWQAGVFTILGQAVLAKQEFACHQLQLNIADLNPGQYFILLKNGAQQQALSFIKD